MHRYHIHRYIFPPETRISATLLRTNERPTQNIGKFSLSLRCYNSLLQLLFVIETIVFQLFVAVAKLIQIFKGITKLYLFLTFLDEKVKIRIDPLNQTVSLLFYFFIHVLIFRARRFVLFWQPRGRKLGKNALTPFRLYFWARCYVLFWQPR